MARRENIVAALRQSVAKIDGTQERLAIQHGQRRLRIGVPAIDTLLDGGLVTNDMHELRCSLSRDISAAAGFLFGLFSGLDSNDDIAWICDPSAVLDSGRLFPDGLAHFGFDSSRLIHIYPMDFNDCLWAAGEAAKTSGLAAVVLHLKGNVKAFDLSATRKLMLRAQSSQTPVFILRQAGEEEASSAATRWHVAPVQAVGDGIYNKGLGHMRLTLTLEKNRNGQTGQWTVAWNPQARSYEHVASTHSLLPFYPSADRQDSASKMGQIVALEKAS
ncbi:MAG: hypothetical protein AAGF25_12625 [Pseudomonadota bacterium]